MSGLSGYDIAREDGVPATRFLPIDPDGLRMEYTIDFEVENVTVLRDWIEGQIRPMSFRFNFEPRPSRWVRLRRWLRGHR